MQHQRGITANNAFAVFLLYHVTAKSVISIFYSLLCLFTLLSLLVHSFTSLNMFLENIYKPSGVGRICVETPKLVNLPCEASSTRPQASVYEWERRKPTQT